jgi:carbamate kinase
VIAGGGGGIPVIRTPEGLRGVEAVIDKDHTAALLAKKLRIDLFVILTDVEGVYENYGKEDQRLVPRLSVARARRGVRSGEYPPGSMGPKVAAAADFASATGHEVLITTASRLQDGVAGRGGTRILPAKVPTIAQGKPRMGAI